MILLALVFGCGHGPVATPPATVAAPEPPAHVTRVQETWRRKEMGNKPDPDVPVNLPRVVLADAAAAARVNALLTPKALFDQERAEIEADGWADGIDFDIDYDQRDLLGLTVTMEGSGAYPDVVQHRLALDLRTGNALGVDAFAPEQRPALVAALERTLQEHVAQAKTRLEPGESIDDLLEGQAVVPADLERYGLSTAGVVFHHELGFPHAMLAAEPDEDLVLPWSELAPYLAPGSALGRGATP